MRHKIASRVARKFIKKSSINLELHIFDFDGTLFRSPEPPEWWSKTAFGHWYTQESSLGLPFIPPKAPASYWIPDVVRDAKDSIDDVEAWAVMCTGRVDNPGLRYRVAELLKGVGLDFDEVHLNATSGSTVRYKQAVTLKLLNKYPQISKVQMWEDTQENLDAVEAICDKYAVSFEGHLISVPPAPSDHVSIGEYVSLLQSDLPFLEWKKVESRLIKKGLV